MFIRECYEAYEAGRAEKDPCKSWYWGEIGFYDFYIIPLAKKLKECGVFGVSSAEYLRYAEQNRKEWQLRGQDIVAGFIAKFNQKHSGKVSLLDFSNYATTFGELKNSPIKQSDMDVLREFQKRKIDQQVNNYRKQKLQDSGKPLSIKLQLFRLLTWFALRKVGVDSVPVY